MHLSFLSVSHSHNVHMKTSDFTPTYTDCLLALIHLNNKMLVQTQVNYASHTCTEYLGLRGKTIKRVSSSTSVNVSFSLLSPVFIYSYVFLWEMHPCNSACVEVTGKLERIWSTMWISEKSYKMKFHLPKDSGQDKHINKEMAKFSFSLE